MARGITQAGQYLMISIFYSAALTRVLGSAGVDAR